MPTPRQLENLRRGGAPATRETAARARAAKAALREQDEAVAAVAAEDPFAGYSAMHATITRHTLRLLRAEEQSGGKPSREVTDRLREFRQLTIALSEYRRSQGADKQAEAFFAELDARVAALAPRLHELSRPLVEPPES